MTYYVTKSNYDDYAIIYTNKQDAIDSHRPYFLIDSIPGGSGVLKTDGNKVWRDDTKPVTNIDTITLLQAQLKAQTERSDFIEDCIAEMAGVVYNTEETTT